MDITAVQPDLVEHVFRSVRGWLHAMYPDLNILITRDETDVATVRPAFRLEVAAGPSWEEANQGWGWLLMSVQVNYAAAVGDKAIFEAQRVAGKIMANAMPPRGRIPLRLYNFAWPEPPTIEVASAVGGALPAGVEVAIAADGDGSSGSAPGSPVGLAVPAGTVIRVRGVNWPTGKPLATGWRIYTAPLGGQLRLQGTIPVDGYLDINELVVAPALVPPTNKSLPFAGLRVESVDSTVVEGTGVERQFDVAVTLRLRTLVPRAWGAQVADELVG